MSVKFKSDFRGTKKVKLPVAGAEIELYDGFIAEQVDKIQKTTNPTTSMMLKMLIKGWDFVDDNDNPLPVEEQYIGKFHVKDVMFLIKESGIEDFLEEAQGFQGPKSTQTMS